jgi:hypothetical protein
MPIALLLAAPGYSPSANTAVQSLPCKAVVAVNALGSDCCYTESHILAAVPGGFLQLKSSNCFQDILSTLCIVAPEQQKQVQPLIPILATVAQRFANYVAPASVACPDGRTLSTVG